MRKALWITPLAIIATVIAVSAWLLLSDAGLQWAYAQARTRLPGTLEAGAIKGRLIGPLEIRDLRYRSDTLDARIAHAVVDWSPLGLLAGRLTLEQLTVAGVDIVSTPSAAPRERDGKFSLPLAVEVGQAALRDIRVQQKDAPGYTLKEIDIAASIDNDALTVERLRVDAEEFFIEAHGALGIHGDSDVLTVNWRVTRAALPVIAGNGTVSGNLSALTLSQQLTAPIAARIDGRVDDLRTAPSWRATAEIPEFALEQLRPAGPRGRLAGTITASGTTEGADGHVTVRGAVAALPDIAAAFRFHAKANSVIAIEDLALTVPGSATRATGNARWNPGDGAWQATLRWQQLAWPLTGEPTLTSADGVIDISGVAATYQLNAKFHAGGPTLPDMRWQATANGDSAAVHFRQVEVRTLDGILSGNADVRWSPALQWSATLQGDALNPGVAWPQWPGALTLRASVKGDARQLRAEVSELRGKLRGYPVRAQARAVRQGDQFPSLSVSLQSADLRAEVSGAIGKRWDLTWRLDAPSLAAALPGASGRFNSSGQLQGPRATPALRAQLSASDVSYHDLRVGELRADVTLDLSDRSRSHGVAQASAVEWRDRVFERVALAAEGFIADHALTIDAQAADVDFAAKFTGRYAGRDWRGMLASSTLTLGTEPWELAESASLQVSSAAFSLDNACWQASSLARLCVSTSRNAMRGIAIDVTARRVPLALLSPALPPALSLTGRFNGDAGFQITEAGARTATARVELDSGRVIVNAAALAYQGATLQLTVDNAGLRAQADLALTGANRGSAQISLPGFPGSNDRPQPLNGRVRLQLPDLVPVAALLPELAELRGSFTADFLLGGTLSEPAIEGQAGLANGSARIPAFGIALQDMRATLTPSGKQTLRLNGYARSGDGDLGFAGQVTFADNFSWRAEMRIAGARFLAADVKEAQVYVSPDLRATMGPGSINVTGEVHVPQARLTPRLRKNAGSVETSQDVVVVNAAGPEDGAAPPSPWRINAEIRVTLGDNVTVDAYGLTASIAGTVTLYETPGQLTTAQGELRVAQGEYEAYGQKLELERGRLLFVGGPVTNPGLDARAIRRVEAITAGVEVKGTLQSPQLTLFSDPAMGQADALSYLLFGKPIGGADAAQGRLLAGAARALRLSGGEQLAQRIGSRFGIEEVEIKNVEGTEQAALVLGKQLSPRLYINYSIGLFEQVNVFRIRYQLSKSWSVEAQSGTTTTGGDLLYTIER
jgi:translocation and assembly module TamB